MEDKQNGNEIGENVGTGEHQLKTMHIRILDDRELLNLI